MNYSFVHVQIHGNVVETGQSKSAPETAVYAKMTTI